ncbi:T9SS type A sorting domain-containing protein [Mangrovibacterium lignilyticum]|uniref:T9SS type A sorting domain-containing protein n=1 Tax=Mangrovibacterium lignilyticum TaxID=2668052 RepID=UPI0013D70E15|nr:T9SS type A sorting domain-containing protein [Mangrovibacterium lignilyticum]
MKLILLLAITLFIYSWTVNGQNNTQWNTHLEGITIDDIADAGDYLWLISGLGTKVIKYDKNSGNVELYDYVDFNIQPDDWFTDVVCDNNGIPWVGTFVGAFKMTDDNTWILVHPEGAWAMTKSKDGVVWIAYQYETIRYEGNNIKVFDAGDYFSSLATDNVGDLWGARQGILFRGLSKYDGNSWNTYTPPYIVGYVTDLAIDANGMKWMSGGALISYDGTNWEEYYTPVETHINSIAIENKSIWCGTKDGLMRFSNSQWTVFDTANSELPSNVVNSIAIDDNGTKWIGTKNGLVAIYNLATANVSVASKDAGFEIHPNPATTYFNIAQNDALPKGSSLEIFTIEGKILKRQLITTENSRIGISDLTNGVYLLRIKSSQGTTVRKLVKN